jgi:hypothetical protein
MEELTNAFTPQGMERNFDIKATRFAKGNYIFPPKLEVRGKEIVFAKRHFQIPIPLFNDEGTWSIFGTHRVILSIPDIAFFNIQGMTNKYLYFGYLDQIEINGVSSSNAKELYEYCKANGAKLSHEGQTFKSSGPWLSIMRHIHPEYLTLTDEALIYSHKTFKGRFTTYLPYTDMSFVFYGKGLLSQSISVLGEQNISPIYNFSKTCRKAIKSKFEKYGIKSVSGIAYSSCRFSSLKYLFGSRPTAWCTMDGLIWTNKRKKEFYNLKNEDLEAYKVVKNGFLFKTIMITVHVTNIRKDQHGTVESFVLPNLLFTKWGFLFWSFGFKRALESKGCTKLKK